MFPTRAVFSALLLLGISPGVRAEPADFSDGFDRLVALGLPSLDGATWTSVASNAPGHPDDMYQLRALFQKMKGSGWKIAPPEGEPLALALGGIETIPWNEKAAKTGNRSKSLLGQIFGAKAKAPKNVDLAADVDALIKSFAKTAKTDEFRSSMEYMDIGPFGTLLIFAAQLHQTGHDDLANRLAASLFSTLPNRERLIDAAITLIADRNYKLATEEFFKSGDWNRYHEQVAALLERFPRGWNKRLAVAMLLSPLEKRAKGDPIPAPAIKGSELHPKAVAALTRLVEQRPTQPKEGDTPQLPGGLKLEDIPAEQHAEILQYYAANMRNMVNRLNVPSLWLLASESDTDSARQSARQSAPKKDSLVGQLIVLGIDALPALAAVADDPTLTYLRNDGGRSYSYFNSNDSPLERASRTYRSLDRPLSRGEIATRLLVAALPGIESGYEQPDPESLREIALDFHTEHHSKSRIQLILVFFGEGNDSQRKQVARILAQSKDPAAWTAFEKHVLEGPPPAESYSTVEFYLKTRKAAAAPFFKKYAALMREEYGDIDLKDDSSGYESSTWFIRQSGGIEKLLKKLAVFVDDADPVDLAREIATSKDNEEDFDASLQGLREVAQDLSRDKAISAYLAGATATEDPDRRVAFIALVFQGPAESKPDKTPQSISENHRRLWKKLLADERPINSDEINWSALRTINEFAALSLESTFDPMFYSHFQTASYIQGSWATPLFLARAKARLENKTPPPLPDASKVSEERFAEILKSAAKLKGPAMFDYVTSLEADEIAAWIKCEETPAFIKAARPYVTHHLDPKAWNSPDMVQNSPEILADGPFKTGTDLSGKNLRNICSNLLRHASDHSPNTFFLSPNYLGVGIDVMIGQTKPRKSGNEYSIDAAVAQETARAAKYLIAAEKADAIISANFFPQKSQTILLLENGKVIRKSDDDEDGESPESDDPQDIFQQFNTLLEAPKASSFYLHIIILTRKDAEAFSKAFDKENPDPSNLPPLE